MMISDQLIQFVLQTRTLGHYAPLILAPAGGWGSVETLLGANKYSCILNPPFHTHTYL